MAKVLVLGDVMLDEYLWCDVERISPEAPVPICRVNRSSHVPGGAGNVAKNLVTLGLDPVLISYCGLDPAAILLKNVLRDEKISPDHLIQDDTLCTIQKSRVLSQNQQIIRLDRENSQTKISSKILTTCKNQIKKLMGDCSCVILSDYGKHVCSVELCCFTIDLAKHYQIPVLVDPKGHDYSKYTTATLIKPNFKEFQEVTQKPSPSEKEIFELGSALIEKLKIDTLLITRSEKGMCLLNHEKRIDVAAEAQEIIDVSGAGDTVIATLAWGIEKGYSIENAARIANIAASIVIKKVGTSAIELKELLENMPAALAT